MVSLLLLLAQPADFKSQASEILTAACQEHKVPGAVALIAQKGKVLAHITYGVRKFGNETPAHKDDPFHLGSVTKSFTGYQVALAAHQNKLDLDDPLTKFFPEFESTDSSKEITVRHLLHHTSGIPDFKSGTALKPDYKAPIIDQRLTITKGVLAAETESNPGSTFRYDNVNYIILGAILESIEKTAWENQTMEGIFKPLNLEKPGFGPTGTSDEDKNPLTPFQHRHLGEVILPVVLDNPPVAGPSATAYMTANDLFKWANLHLDGALGRTQNFPQGIPTDPKFWNDLHRPGENVAYGMGWVSGRPTSEGIYGFAHSGSNTMSLCTLFVDVKTETVGIIMMNAAPELTAADNVMREMLTLLLAPNHSAD